MQFSLLSILNGLPDLTALANGASAQDGQGQGAGDQLFSELLGDLNGAGGDLQQGGQQAGGDLAQELVTNLTVAQEVDADVTDTVDITAVRDLLSHKITPEEARDLLAKMDSDAQGSEQAPSELHELLENIEANGEAVSVEDMMAHVPTPQDGEAAEAKQNTVQRMLQWLQQAINPNAAPLEALAAANAAAMFQDAKAAQITAADRALEKEREKDAVGVIGALPTVELPEVSFDTSAAAKDTLVLVATKQNSEGVDVHAPRDAMDAFVADLGDQPVDVAKPADASDAALQADTDATPTLVTHSAQQSHSPEARTAENVRIHHANFAYQQHEIMDQVQVGIKHAVRDGMDRITIQLNPSELGRVEVKLDVVADGMSHVSFLVEKQETFDLLQRDARTLERMLQEAGVRADAGSMEFNLNQNNQSKEPWGEANGGSDRADGEEISSTLPSSELPTQMYVHLVSDRVDIRA